MIINELSTSSINHAKEIIMNMEKKVLGRGLDALFGNNNPIQESQTASKITDIAIDLLVANPKQPRKYFDEKSLQELADSITSQGIIQPLLVRLLGLDGKYEIIAGERRYRAAIIANLKVVPAYVRQMTDTEVMIASLIENVQREDLNAIEEALALKRLRDEFMITQDELSKKIGKSRSTIANSLRLLNLSDAARADLITGKINAGHARSLLSIDDAKAQEKLHTAIISHELTVRDSENAVKDWKNGVPFFWENDASNVIGANQSSRNVADVQLDANVQVKKEKVKSSRKKSETIKTIQKQLNEQLKLRANISGSEEKGKITLSYQNAEEFAQLLQKIGLEK